MIVKPKWYKYNPFSLFSLSSSSVVPKLFNLMIRKLEPDFVKKSILYFTRLLLDHVKQENHSIQIW